MKFTTKLEEFIEFLPFPDLYTAVCAFILGDGGGGGAVWGGGEG